ncbi:MAG: hypothetical protein M3Y71_11860 [Actinomycetota bacterium]|nr:hypothetical protein [Actinomycetota bacterium]
MTDEQRPGRLVLVAGAPGTDPHAVAQGVAAGLVRAVHLDVEALESLVVTGGVPMVDPPSPEAVEQLFLRWLAGIAVGETYQRAGFDAILSERVAGDFLADLLDFVDPAPLHLVVLEGDGSEGGGGSTRGLRVSPREGTPEQVARSVLTRLDEGLLG